MRSLLALALVAVLAAFAVPPAMGSPQVLAVKEKPKVFVAMPAPVAVRAAIALGTSAPRVASYAIFHSKLASASAAMRPASLATDAKVRVDPGWRSSLNL